jgi:membrane-associated phospholipid phosphatase
MKNIATIFSRIFDPFISLAIVFIVLFYNTDIFVPAFMLMIALPFVLFLIAWKTKFVSNWDVSDRRQRPKLLWTLIGIELIGSLLLRTTAVVPVLVILIGFTLITQFWKISGHAVSAALMTGVVIARAGVTWWPILLIVPLVGWARVIRKDHTVLQVIAGALYSWISLIVLDNWIIR